MADRGGLIVSDEPHLLEEDSFGRRVFHEREKRHETQAQFAGRVGVTEDTIRNWESGRVIPKLTNIQKLAKRTGRKISYFMEPIKRGLGLFFTLSPPLATVVVLVLLTTVGACLALHSISCSVMRPFQTL